VSAPLDPATTAELRHELRTPVNHILGYAELLAEDVPRDTPSGHALETIREAAREVLAAINQALPPSGASDRGALDALLQALRVPQGRILAQTSTLDASATDAQFRADVAKIAIAARQLCEPPTARHADSTTPASPAPATTTTDVAEGPSVAKPTPHAGSEAIGVTRGRILVVDDVEENRSVLGRRLAREGYAVTEASGGIEALQLIALQAFDLVLLDVRMPDLDGFTVLERIKGAEATRNLPVIMISALDDIAAVVRCIEHGAEDYLAKPFDQVLLRARIGASLEKKRWHDREADYLRQVTRVTDAAAAVERGSYQAGMLGHITARDDELGRLARVFDTMAAGVKAREAKLHAQLSQLRADVNIATSEHRTVDAVSDAGTDALAPGAVLANRYEIRSVIGRGGMGVVYRAFDRELSEDIAIKTIRRDLLTTDPVLGEQLKSEIRLARRISHRHVVRTHDLGEADGIAFVTMECVTGITLRELLETRGRLGSASTLAIARQFADALAVAHQAGVIHRDVKPENALVDAEGVLKVMDFGIARIAAASTRTSTGLIVGTPAYMAPEQLVDEAVDARADLYALGVVLYECLCGHPPFGGANMVAMIAKVLTTPPTPVSQHVPDVPPALAALVMRLLAKAPDQRPGDAAELVALLGELD
jgi:CheY-like chemotaxis protein/tRNA A-37 threonylcarbamoyl transferase component Bud32